MTNKTLYIEDIYKILPHRYPFLMVDRILSIEKNERVVGIKNVSINEPYFQGHFPDQPIMPAVLILESMAQIGGFVFDLKTERAYVVGIERAKFRKMVRPGDVLFVECEYMQRFNSIAKIKAKAIVDGVEVANATISYMFSEKDTLWK